MGAYIATNGMYVSVGYQQLIAAPRQLAGAVIIVDKEDVLVRVRQSNARSCLGKRDILIRAGHRLQRHANCGSAAGKTADDLDGRVVGQIDVVVRIVRLVILDLHGAGEPERTAVAQAYAAAVGSAGRGCISDCVSSNFSVAGHGEDGVVVHIYTATARDRNFVCVSSNLIFTDLTAGHGKHGSRCSSGVLTAHMRAAAGYDSLIFADLAAMHGKGSIVVHIHAAASCRGVALDGAAVHGEGTYIHVHARAPIGAHIVAADSAAVHGEFSA